SSSNVIGIHTNIITATNAGTNKAATHTKDNTSGTNSVKPIARLPANDYRVPMTLSDDIKLTDLLG
ncbi:hypothetical protein BGZ99_009575, partial [Dissophora globulifera]